LCGAKITSTSCARYAALQQSELFRGIRYSEDHQQIKAWAPLVMEGRDPLQKVAATRRKWNRRQLWKLPAS
jgi:L-2-hydroxyglutarate oxidase LhgO